MKLKHLKTINELYSDTYISAYSKIKSTDIDRKKRFRTTHNDLYNKSIDNYTDEQFNNIYLIIKTLYDETGLVLPDNPEINDDIYSIFHGVDIYHFESEPIEKNYIIVEKDSNQYYKMINSVAKTMSIDKDIMDMNIINDICISDNIKKFWKEKVSSKYLEYSKEDVYSIYNIETENILNYIDNMNNVGIVKEIDRFNKISKKYLKKEFNFFTEDNSGNSSKYFDENILDKFIEEMISYDYNQKLNKDFKKIEKSPYKFIEEEIKFKYAYNFDSFIDTEKFEKFEKYCEKLLLNNESIRLTYISQYNEVYKTMDSGNEYLIYRI